ncbi:MAG: hypothetical protein IPN72_22610 [Saprospiraceae bacterium]|nr:hypothetical protein [Saprospiraceae bacterium]
MDSVWLGIKYNQSQPEPLRSFIETYALHDKTYGISDKPIITSKFSLDFSKYDVVISNLGASAALWPVETQKSLKNT